MGFTIRNKGNITGFFFVQIWTDSTDSSIPKILSSGYATVFSTSDDLYLDCGFGYYVGEGNSWCDPYKQWRTLYQHDPRKIYLEFPDSDRSRLGQILGSEAPIWTESVGPDAVETRLWPRAAALAERLWSDPGEAAGAGGEAEPAWVEAERRFVHHRERLVERGVRAEAVQPTWCHQFEDRCRNVGD